MRRKVFWIHRERKLKWVAASVAVLLVGAGVLAWSVVGEVGETRRNVELVRGVNEEADGQIDVVIDYGDEVGVYGVKLKEGQSVLDVLEEAGRNNGFEVVKKEFDFGPSAHSAGSGSTSVMVETINGREGTSERAWIYFVNGGAGDVGAGEKLLKAGDEVEWKYEEIN